MDFYKRDILDGGLLDHVLQLLRGAVLIHARLRRGARQIGHGRGARQDGAGGGVARRQRPRLRRVGSQHLLPREMSFFCTRSPNAFEIDGSDSLNKSVFSTPCINQNIF